MIKLIGSGLKSLGQGAKHVGKFIADNGGRQAWNAVKPHLQKAASFVGEDVHDVGSGLKWLGSKALGAVKAANDFDDNYLGGAVKTKLAGMAVNYLNNGLSGINNTSSLVRAGRNIARNHLSKLKGIIRNTGGALIGSSFKDMTSTNPYSVYSMSHM